LTQWHADLNGPALAIGASVTILSDHHVVRVLTADTLMIERPDGQRFSAVVLDRTGTKIELFLPDGRLETLELELDEALHEPKEGAIFSHQTWVNH
jgi:hypothetical protein